MKYFTKLFSTVNLIALLLSFLLLGCKIHKQQEGTELHYYLQVNHYFSIMNNDMDISSAKLLLGNDTTEIYPIYDLIDQPKLVFRFSGKYCDACINYVIKELKNEFPDFEVNNNIWLVGTDINPRMKINYYDKVVFSFTDSDFEIPFEEELTPFLFILDRDRKIKMFFIPEQEFHEHTENYLKIIKQRYNI